MYILSTKIYNHFRHTYTFDIVPSPYPYICSMTTFQSLGRNRFWYASGTNVVNMHVHMQKSHTNQNIGFLIISVLTPSKDRSMNASGPENRAIST